MRPCSLRKGNIIVAVGRANQRPRILASQDGISQRNPAHIRWPLHLVPWLCRLESPLKLTTTCPAAMVDSTHIGTKTFEICSRVFHYVCVESCLPPLTRDQFPVSTNKSDEARLDIRTRGFWATGQEQQDAFFAVMVFYSFASSYRNSRLPTLYRQHESRKGSTTDSDFEKLSAGASLPSFSPLEAAWHLKPQSV